MLAIFIKNKAHCAGFDLHLIYSAKQSYDNRELLKALTHWLLEHSLASPA